MKQSVLGHKSLVLSRFSKQALVFLTNQFTLPVVLRTNGLTAGVRRESEQPHRALDGVSEAPHHVEIRCRAAEFTVDGDILEPQQVFGSLLGQDNAVAGHRLTVG